MTDTSTNLEIYKLMVEDVREARRARRELSNTFMTLNVAGVGAFITQGAEGNMLDPAIIAMSAFALALTCLIWMTTNSYYRHLLAAKYAKIYALEDRLEVHPIKEEWQAMNKRWSAMRWFSLERAMPLLFIVGYTAFFATQVSGADVSEIIDSAADLLRQLGLPI